MPAHTPSLMATRFVALDDGTSLDLASGGRVWIERRVLDDVARAVWPEMMARLWRLWHPALAPCVDFGFVSANEWFEAYALRPPAPADPLSAQAASLPAFLRAHGVVCGLQALEPRRRSRGLMPTLPVDGAPDPRSRPGPGLGMRLVHRPLEAHVLTALDDRRSRGPRVWNVDAVDGSGWRTSWRRLAREARLRGYVPVQAAVLESAVRRDDGHHTSWLALLDGFALLVLHERAGWQLPERQGLARLLVRLGGADSPGTVVLDVVRRGRPRRAAHILDALPAEDLARRFGYRPHAVRRSGCAPARLPHRPTDCPAPLSRASPLGLACAPTSRRCTNGAPAFATTETASPVAGVDPVGILEKARALAARGRTALAQRHVQRAAWACGRRNAHAACARLLVESSRLAAARGDLRQSRHWWRQAGRLAPAAHVACLVEGAADVAEQWIRQAALVDAEYLLHAALGASRVLDAPSPPRLVALLVTCLCWQARWADALQQASADSAATGRAGRARTRLGAARAWRCRGRHGRCARSGGGRPACRCGDRAAAGRGRQRRGRCAHVGRARGGRYLSAGDVAG